MPIRLLMVALLWLSLSGLASAAACVSQMGAQEETCSEHAPAPIQIECCALESAGAVGAPSIEPAKRQLSDVVIDDLGLAFASAEAWLTRLSARASPRAPPLVEPSLSYLWLETARLRR